MLSTISVVFSDVLGTATVITDKQFSLLNSSLGSDTNSPGSTDLDDIYDILVIFSAIATLALFILLVCCPFTGRLIGNSNGPTDPVMV